MSGLVVTGPSALPYGISGYPNFNTDSGAIAPVLNSEIAKKSFPTMVQYLLPQGEATLLGLSSKLKEETAVQIEHGFFAKIMIFPSFTVSTAVANSTAGDVAIDVYDSSQVIPNGLYKRVGTTTGGSGALTPITTYDSEIVLVNSVPGSTSINIKRSADFGAANIALDSTFVHIGNAFPDASTRPNSFLTREIRVINYTQIFRDAWAISGTVAAIQNVIGDTNIAKSRNECGQYHAMAIEKSLIFGKRSNSSGTAGSSNAFRTMGGVIAQISDGQSTNLFLPGTTYSSNISVANSSVNGTPTAGALSIDDLEAWADNLVNMSYTPQSGNERLCFVGKTAHIVINRLARLNSSYFIENGTTEWGLRFSKINMTRFTLYLVEHPLFNTNLHWARMALAIDESSISLAYMMGRKTKPEEYNQLGTAIDNAIDAQGGSLLTELTVLCKNPAGCGIMTNIQHAVSADGLTSH